MLVPVVRGRFDHFVAVGRHRSDQRDFKSSLVAQRPGRLTSVKHVGAALNRDASTIAISVAADERARC